MDHHGMDRDTMTQTLRRALADPAVSRRQFLWVGGISIVGMSALGPGLASVAAKPVLIMEQARGLVLADPTRCVGCRRCELACTEFNDGKAAPSMARVKIARNLNFGPLGAGAGQLAQGNWGNGLIVQELCKQCPHPVPCADACPSDAIVIRPPTNARVVDAERCTGCRLCQKACPWGMLSFDGDTGKATKCFLCDGSPKCVEACPAAALHYVSWRDLTHKVPPRVARMAILPPEKAALCNDCHKR